MIKKIKKTRAGRRSEGGEENNNRCWELLRRRPTNSRTTLFRRLESYKSAKDTLQTAAVVRRAIIKAAEFTHYVRPKP